MRRGTNDFGILKIGDEFIGISLGADFTSEHEWGTDGIKRSCGMPEGSEKNMGLACRSITKKPSMHFIEGVHEGVKHAVMFTYREWRSTDNTKVNIPRDLDGYINRIKSSVNYITEVNKRITTKNKKRKPENVEKLRDVDDPIITAWDADSFGVAVYGDKETEWLKELYQAFDDINVTIASIGGNSAFSNSSLSLMIKDRIPNEIKESMYLADKEYYDRVAYEKKIGMTKIIAKYGNKNGHKGDKYFMACSPKWFNYEDEVAREKSKEKHNTKYDIWYWVNYSDNDENYGWYSVEEIREWMTTDKKLTEIRKG